jgi:type II secretory ATPase GspE/PulE/Tfp pilus assembly ATPase PilB-like protein
MVELKGILTILESNGLIGKSATIGNIEINSDDRPDRALVEAGIVQESDMVSALAEYLKLPMANPSSFPTVSLPAGGANVTFLRQTRILPIFEDETSITLAMADPLDSVSIQSIKLLLNKTIKIQVAAAADLDRAFGRLYEKTRHLNSSDVIQHQTVDEKNSPAIKLFDQLVNTAILNKASDLHIESSSTGIRLRYRIDGKLLELGNQPPLYLKDMLTSRIKILANLNIAEKRLPQDGRTTVSISGRPIDIRISTIPTINGESIVLRFLDSERGPNNLETLGFNQKTIDTLRRLLKAPHGMILTTGPTGSGKTTTLYAALKELNLQEQKVITLEDPIEYRLENVNQIQINSNAGLGFVNLLRSVLRQDPDIIMVGEIRDEETARLAAQSALTGHLVLSTLHTNDAFGAITRLLNMGLEPFLITAALRAVIGQRLIRRLCANCKKPGIINTTEHNEFGLKMGASIGRPNGCDACYQTGYSGRIALTELIELDDNLRQKINNSAVLTSADYRKQNDNTLFAAAKTHILEGETSIEEYINIMGLIN